MRQKQPGVCSLIVTPGEMIDVDDPPPPPAGIMWTLLDKDDLDAVPVLAALKAR